MIINIKLHKNQKKVVSQRKRYNVIRCGRRWGKSHLLFALAAEKMSEKNKIVLYTAPTYTDTEKRYLEAKEYFEKIGAECKQGLIKWNNSYLEFRGLHRYDAIRGNKYHRALMDEWAISKLSKEAWEEAIAPTLMDFQGDAYFCSTPKIDTHFQELDKLSKSSDKWASFHFTSYDGLVKHEEIDNLKLILPENVFQQEVMAEYIALDGNMFPQKYVRYDSFECDTIFMAVDLAISTKEQADYSAICVLGRSKDRWLIKYVEQKKSSFHGIMNWIKEIAEIYNPDIIGIEKVAYQDAMIQSLIVESNLNIVGIPVKTDKITRAMALQVRYETGLIFHEKNLMGSDFEKQLFSFPNGEHDDMVDATVHAFNLQSQFASANVYGVR